MQKEFVDILGVKINNISLDETVKCINNLINNKAFSYTVTPNVDHLMKLQDNEDFKKIYRNASLKVADGVPLIWASKFLGTPLKGRVNGTDLFERLSKNAASCNHSVFLLGGEEGSAEKTANILQKKYPKLRVSGWYCPPFGFERDESHNEYIVNEIKSANSTLLFVGLGAPKQEKWIFHHGPKTGAKHAVGIGVSFSFVSGFQKRAPIWMQKSGFEWIWRLSKEPNRLWRRYLIDDMQFFWHVFLQKYSKNYK